MIQWKSCGNSDDQSRQPRSVVFAIWIWWGNTALEVNEYEIADSRIPQSFDGFRIAQISDLHNAQFGEDNCKLIGMLSGADPDIIVLTGDLIDSRNTDIEIALEFARSAMEIAPVYYVTGNRCCGIEDHQRNRQISILVLSRCQYI